MAQLADIPAQRTYYDRRWTETGDDYANLLQLGRAIAVLEGLRLINQRSPRILDLGCGSGWLTSMLGRFGPTTGIDLSPIAIAKASERYPDIDFVAGDFFEAGLTERSFDVVVSCQVLDHMPDHAGFFDLVWRLLKPHGHFIVVTTNPWPIRRWDQDDFVGFSGGLQPIEHWLTRAQLGAILRERFRIRRLRTLLPGYGNRGALRLLHSARLAHGLRALGLLDFYHNVLLRCGCGLLLYAVAQRRTLDEWSLPRVASR